MNTGKVVPLDNEIISLRPDLGKYFNKNKSIFSKSSASKVLIAFPS